MGKSGEVVNASLAVHRSANRMRAGAARHMGIVRCVLCGKRMATSDAKIVLPARLRGLGDKRLNDRLCCVACYTGARVLSENGGVSQCLAHIEEMLVSSE